VSPSTSSEYDAIVVGAGHNGIVASFYLARAGMRVLLLERGERVGGLSTRIEFMPGYIGSIPNSPGSLEKLVSDDMHLSDFGLSYVRPDPTVVIPFHGGKGFIGYRDRDTLKEEIARFSKRDSTAYFQVLRDIESFARELGVSVLEPPPSLAELTSRLTTAEQEDWFARLFFGSARDLVDSYMESDEMKAVLAMLAMIIGGVGPSTPGSAFGFLLRPMSMASSRVHGEDDPRNTPLRGSTGLPQGGMGAVTEAMARSATAAGVTILTEAPVASISMSEAGVSGVVLTDGREFRAPIVVSNANPKTTLMDMGDPELLPDPIRERLERTKMEGGAFKIGVALSGIPRFTFAKNRGLGDNDDLSSCQFRIAPTMDYLDDAWENARRGIPSPGPKVWGLIPSLTDPTLAPEGKHFLSLNVWYAPYTLAEGEWDARRRDDYARHCINTLAEYMPDLPGLVEDFVAYSPLDLEEKFGLTEGNQLHGDMNPGRMFSLRPVAGMSDYRTPIKGLYLCGSGVWPGGTVTGLPGRNSAHQVIRDWETEVGEPDLEVA